MSLLSKAVEHIAHEVEKAAGDAADAGQDVVDAFTEAGMRFVDAVDDLGKGLIQILTDDTIAIRSLRPNEKAILRDVYHSSEPPLQNILVVSLIGIGGRPFTLPLSMLPTLAAPLLPPTTLMLLQLVLLAAKRTDYYLLFLGRRGYNDAINLMPFNRPGDTLVHEMAHVWQGYHSAFTWEYVFNSVYYQVSGGAYIYSPGAQWDTYGAEQQARIVEDWYARGGLSGDDLYPYILCNVRPGRPHATTEFTSTIATPSSSTMASVAPAGALGRVSPVRPGIRGK
jgi:hypothetical protein